MALHLSDQTSSFKSSARPRRDILPESPRTTEFACWSGFNQLCLGERVKNGLRGVLQPTKPSLGSCRSLDESQPTLDELENTFSPIGSSSSDARLYLTQTPFEAGPPTVVWASPKPTWGQWPCLSFSYCISVMTERDASAVYVVDTPGSESGSDSNLDLDMDMDSETGSPFPPVYECTLDGVMHLWLIVPSRPSVDGMVQLSEEQMRAAMEFYDRCSLSMSLSSGPPGSSAASTATIAVDPYDCKRGGEDDDDDPGYHHYYADARDADSGAGAVLLTCADGNEVDAVALAVLLLARQHSHSHPRGYDRGRSATRGVRPGAHGVVVDVPACHGVGSYTAYQASSLIDDDPQVSHVWKGLLEWQDVERMQAALLSCVY